ncbi:MAG: ABC transporter permease subunit [Clostridiaceae bacterium]|nr:ABC transporter permease subunit [Clostridiaceae bacterium]
MTRNRSDESAGSLLMDHKRPLLQRIKMQWVILLMLLPSVILVFVFNTIPLAGLWMAFTKYKIGKGLFTAQFVGLSNFARLFSGGDITHLLSNTLIVNIANLAISTILSIGFAVLLRELPGKLFAKIMQTVSFFPFFISWVIVYSVVQAMMGVNSGAINNILQQAGFIDKGINVLGNEDYAYGLTIFLTQWKSLGYNAILYVAAMASIPIELYEAAAIDGAGRYRRIWYITLPGILPTFSILLIMAVGNILNSGIDFFFVFTNSSNWRKMEMFDYYVYSRGLQKGDFSYATAVGIMKSIISIILLAGANWTTKKVNGHNIF